MAQARSGATRVRLANERYEVPWANLFARGTLAEYDFYTQCLSGPGDPPRAYRPAAIRRTWITMGMWI